MHHVFYSPLTFESIYDMLGKTMTVQLGY